MGKPVGTLRRAAAMRDRSMRQAAAERVLGLVPERIRRPWHGRVRRPQQTAHVLMASPIATPYQRPFRTREMGTGCTQRLVSPS